MMISFWTTSFWISCDVCWMNLMKMSYCCCYWTKTNQMKAIYASSFWIDGRMTCAWMRMIFCACDFCVYHDVIAVCDHHHSSLYHHHWIASYHHHYFRPHHHPCIYSVCHPFLFHPWISFCDLGLGHRDHGCGYADREMTLERATTS